MVFIKKSWRTYEGRKYEQYHIVKSMWDAKKKRPKREYIINVTELSERQREMICAALNGEDVGRRWGGKWNVKGVGSMERMCLYWVC